MELFGIAFSIPTAFAATVAYAFLVGKLLPRFPWFRKPALVASLIVLLALALEWCLLGTRGAVGCREMVGPLFYPAHLVVFLLSLPALANLVVMGKQGSPVRWLVAGVLCAALDLPVVLTQYYVSEALYGVDGSGGPYGTE